MYARSKMEMLLRKERRRNVFPLDEKIAGEYDTVKGECVPSAALQLLASLQQIFSMRMAAKAQMGSEGRRVDRRKEAA